MSKILIVAASSLFIYQILDVWMNLHSSIHHYAVHLTLTLIVGALAWGKSSAELGTKRARGIGQAVALGMALAVAGAGAYLYANADALQMRQPFLNTGDYVAGFVMIVAVIVLNWVFWGKMLSGICAAAGLYFAFGHYLPGVFEAPKAESFIIMSYLAGLGTARGIMNYMPLSADTIILLIVYGGLLGSLKIIDMFSEIGRAIGRIVEGGIAYSAVVASSLIGMVTGQAVSNIVLSGSMTIPTMKRSGFSGDKAGAIECLASNGSQIIPPIMGLGAFLIAALLGIPYINVAAAATIPAILYVAIVLISVGCLVRATPNVKAEEGDVNWRLVYSVAPSFLISLGAIIYVLSNHYSGGMAGFWGISILVVLSYLRPKEFRPEISDAWRGVVDGIANAAKLAVVLAAIGILVQTMITTGLGFVLGRLMLDLSGGSLTVGLLLGMVLSLLIGMGLPTPAAYSVIAIVVVPVLIDLGVADLSAHFFGFYFGVFSSISPPVAVGVLTAVRISGSGFMATALECMKLGAVGFLLPFMFVAFPGILNLSEFGGDELFAIVLMLLATFMLGTVFYGTFLGRLSSWERGILVMGPIAFAVYLFAPALWLSLVGPAALALVVLLRMRRSSANGLV